MTPPSLLAPLEVTRAPRQLHGPFARTVMVALGVLFVFPFGGLGCFIAFHAGRASSPWGALKGMVAAGLLFAVAVYGAWLAGRGLRGYSRPTLRTDRLLFTAAVFLCAAGVASYLAMMVTFFSVGPVVLQRASWHSLNGTAWIAAMMSLALPLQLAAHELGHVVAGHLVGFEFLSIQVGPFCLDRPCGRWRVTWQPLAFGLGGRATVAFHGSHRLPQRTATFAAGGPAANLLLALVAGVAAAAAPLPGTAAAAVAVGFLNGCAAEGVLLCVLNLVPVRGTGTDGARILHALRPPRTP